MKVGRVAIITRGRFAGKKVRQDPHPPRSTREEKKKEADDEAKDSLSTSAPRNGKSEARKISEC
jgi:hypothetical protein